MKHIFDKHVVKYDTSEAEQFAEVATKPLKALSYDTSGRSLWHLNIHKGSQLSCWWIF
ncbi:hypothetical protein Hanom_Chr14g01283801 [Helianthus anomalus]